MQTLACELAAEISSLASFGIAPGETARHLSAGWQDSGRDCLGRGWYQEKLWSVNCRMRLASAVERIWHTHDSHGQILAPTAQVRAKQIKKKVEVRRDAKSGPGRPAAASGGERSPGGGQRGGSDGKASGPATEYDAEQRILVLGDGDFSFSRGVHATLLLLYSRDRS